MDRRTEYESQVPAAARLQVPTGLQSPAAYTTTPLGMDPKPVTPVPSFTPSIPSPVMTPVEKPAPTAIPQGAMQSLVPEKTAKSDKPEKPVRTKPKNPNDLEDYSYTLSAAELARVRKEQPTASPTVSVENTAVPLSWEEYDRLTPDQRAAVDMNGLLVEARQVDLKADLKTFPNLYSDADLKQYQIDVESIFGKGGGSDTIGFQTVALLKRIDFKAVGQDLDEFLSLERSVSAKDLKDFSFSTEDMKALNTFTPEASVVPAQYDSVRSDANLAAVDTALIQSALAAYKTNIDTAQPRPWSIQASLGIPQAGTMVIPEGGGRKFDEKSFEFQFDTAVNEAYGFLQQHPDEAGLAAIFQDFKDRNWEPENQQRFWNYIDTRSQNEVQTLGSETAKQIRDALGWK